jgi:hypothetical protein
MTEKPAFNAICLAGLATVAQTIGWCVGSMVVGAIIFVLSLLVIRSNFAHGGTGSCGCLFLGAALGLFPIFMGLYALTSGTCPV